MNWIEVTINAGEKGIDALCDELDTLGVDGIVINDEKTVNDFLETERKYWDYVDDCVYDSVKGVSSVSFYLEDSEEGVNEFKRIRSYFTGYDIFTKHVRDEDWENNWKQYYKPIETGERLLIVPEWYDTPNTDRTVLKLDPGLIFGTGSHATTRMCLEAVESFTPDHVLDLGCGSGILAIAALLLGAKTADCIDIDDKAPDVVSSNGALNGLGHDVLQPFAGDVLNDAGIKRRLRKDGYDLVFANIVADVIIALAPSVPAFLRPGGVFITSGIIDGREDEVSAAILNAGFEITEHRHIDNWHCFVCRTGDAK